MGRKYRSIKTPQEFLGQAEYSSVNSYDFRNRQNNIQLNRFREGKNGDFERMITF